MKSIINKTLIYKPMLLRCRAVDVVFDFSDALLVLGPSLSAHCEKDFFRHAATPPSTLHVAATRDVNSLYYVSRVAPNTPYSTRDHYSAS